MFQFKRLVLLALFIAGFLFSQAQVINIDSLGSVLKGNAGDVEKAKAHLALAQSLIFKDFEACQEHLKAGATLAEKTKDYGTLSELKKFTGLSWYFKGAYDSAAVYYYKALNILKTHKDPLKKAGLLNELGKLYRKTRDLDRALEMYNEAFDLYRSLNNEDGMATILNESGVVYEYKEDYTEAVRRYTRSMEIREKMGDLVGKSYSLNFIGGVYTLQKNFTQAENYLLQSLAIRQQLKDSFPIALNHSDLGMMYKEQGNYKKAIAHFKKSNAYAIQIGFLDLQLSNYQALAAIAEKQGDHALALSYYKNQTTLKDSIYSGEKMKQIEELDAKYQTEKKEQQLKLQQAEIERKNYLLWGIIIAAILLALSAINFYRRRLVQNKLNLQHAVMKQQDQATRAIINAEENERKRIAADLHDGVGQMMSAAKMNLSAFENDIQFKDEGQRTNFERLSALVDESCREIRNVSHQMMPNALLKSGLANAVREFLDKIDNRVIHINLYTEGLDERLETNLETVMYRVIQECVNNVIKHSGATNLDISLIKGADDIAVTIEDNGRGFDTTDKQKFEGIGLKNITSRVTFLKGTVEFDSAEGKGTLVAIHVPIAG